MVVIAEAGVHDDVALGVEFFELGGLAVGEEGVVVREGFVAALAEGVELVVRVDESAGGFLRS